MSSADIFKDLSLSLKDARKKSEENVQDNLKKLNMYEIGKVEEIGMEMFEHEEKDRVETSSICYSVQLGVRL